MRQWRAARAVSVALAMFLALMLGKASAAVAAEGPVVATVSDRFINGMYMLDGRVRFALTPDMRDALENGIALSYDVEVEIYGVRDWLWDELLVRSVQRITLEYHALSGSYTVSNVTARMRRSFQHLDEALDALGDLRDLAVSEQRHLPKPGPYRGRLRVGMDLQTLPAPLRPIAYLSPDWPLHSDWYEWTVTP